MNPRFHAIVGPRVALRHGYRGDMRDVYHGILWNHRTNSEHPPFPITLDDPPDELSLVIGTCNPSGVLDPRRLALSMGVLGQLKGLINIPWRSLTATCHGVPCELGGTIHEEFYKRAGALSRSGNHLERLVKRKGLGRPPRPDLATYALMIVPYGELPRETAPGRLPSGFVKTSFEGPKETPGCAYSGGVDLEQLMVSGMIRVHTGIHICTPAVFKVLSKHLVHPMWLTEEVVITPSP